MDQQRLNLLEVRQYLIQQWYGYKKRLRETPCTTYKRNPLVISGDFSLAAA
jgi:hypothetical protein